MEKNFWLFVLMIAASAFPHTNLAQMPSNTYEELDFDSPEGWAMAYMTASALNLGLQFPQISKPGDISFSIEVGSIPRLNKEQQLIGFGGFKDEDLNKSPIFGRASAYLGLIWDLTAELSWTPPIELNGAKPDKLWGLALSKPLMSTESWRVGLRLYAVDGAVNADVTCSEDVAKFPPFSSENLFGCVDASNDSLELDHYGAEMILSFKESTLGIQPWASIASTRMDPFVEVDALLQGSSQFATVGTKGITTTYTAGFKYSLSENWNINLASSYTPLEAVRPMSAGGQDSYWNIRIGLLWDL